MYNIVIPEDVKSFVESIQERVKDRFTVYIGGGYGRDLCCGKTPKDVDIFFVPREGFEGEEVSYIPAKCYVQYNKRVSELSETSDMDERGISQVIGLSNKSLSTTDLQFIVYEKYLTMQEVAEDFDISICQVVWCSLTDTIFETKAFIEGHNEQTIECLKNYNEKRMYERVIRMMDKFPEYTVINMPETPLEYKVVEDACTEQGHSALDSLKVLSGVVSSRTGGSFVGEDT